PGADGAAPPIAREERRPTARPAPMSPWPFRMLWAGNVFVQAGYWMQQVGVGWLMLELTDSSTQLGIVSFLRGLPMLVGSPVAGRLVDRLDRRRLLIGSQATMALSAAAIAPLVALGWVQPWHVYALALISGAAVTLNFPARQTIIPAVVPPGQVGRAVAQIAAGQNGSRLKAPGIPCALTCLRRSAPRLWGLASTLFPALPFTLQD